jgi:sulfofructose kinase
MEHMDVLVIGRSCLDNIAVVETFPAENQKVPLTFRIMEGGGQGGTAACCIAKLGGRVTYIGKLGDDDAGRFCLKRLKEFGVDTDGIDIVKNGKTPVAYAFVTKSNGHRTIIYESNTLPKIEFNSAITKLLSQTRVVLLDPEVTYLGPSLRSMVNDKVKIVYDCERWRDGIQEMMGVADFFIPSSDFLDSQALALGNKTFTEKMLGLKEMVAGHLIVTRGGQGADYFSGDSLYRIPSPDVAVKDTIGAGDNFHAAFALAVSKEFALPDAVKLALAAASLSCRAYGGREGIPNWQEAIRAAEKLKVKAVELN